MNNLNKCFCLSACFTYGYSFTRRTVLCQCCLKDINKRAISRQEYRMFIRFELMTGIGNIQPSKRFPRTRNTGYETDCFSA